MPLDALSGRLNGETRTPTLIGIGGKGSTAAQAEDIANAVVQNRASTMFAIAANATVARSRRGSGSARGTANGTRPTSRLVGMGLLGLAGSFRTSAQKPVRRLSVVSTTPLLVMTRPLLVMTRCVPTPGVKLGNPTQA